MGREKQYLTNNKLKLSFYMKSLGRSSLLLKSSFIMLIGLSQGVGLGQTTTFTVYAFSFEALLISGLRRVGYKYAYLQREKNLAFCHVALVLYDD